MSGKTDSEKTAQSNIKIHKLYSNVTKDGKKVERDEEIIYGDKGLKFKLYTNENGNKQKLIGKLTQDGTYRFIHIDNDKKDVKEGLTQEKLIDIVKKESRLDFVIKFISAEGKKEKKAAKGGARKMSKTSKKGSRSTKGKSTKKGSTTKKAPKKSSRK